MHIYKYKYIIHGYININKYIDTNIPLYANIDTNINI